jgi:hypothetical protein
MMLKYLDSRACPKCHSSVTVMLLRFGLNMSTINGVCGSCDYAMKWLIVRGNKPARQKLEAGQTNDRADESGNRKAAK